MGTHSVPSPISSLLHLDAEEQEKLARLAQAEDASSEEILRRSLRAYDPAEERELQALIVDMDQVLGEIAGKIQTNIDMIDATLESIERLRAGRT